MNVSLTPKLKRYVEKRVKSGDYGSASEVVRDSLRLLEARELQLKELRREIQLGIDSVAEGRSVTYSSKEEFVRDMMGRVRMRSRQARKRA